MWADDIAGVGFILKKCRGKAYVTYHAWVEPPSGHDVATWWLLGWSKNPFSDIYPRSKEN